MGAKGEAIVYSLANRLAQLDRNFFSDRYQAAYPSLVTPE